MLGAGGGTVFDVWELRHDVGGQRPPRIRESPITRATPMSGSLAIAAACEESKDRPATSVNRRPPKRKESTIASVRAAPAGVRAETSAIPSGAAATAAGRAGSARSKSLRKCPS